MKVQVSSNNVWPGDGARDVAAASALDVLALSLREELSILVVRARKGSSGVDGG
jgi:hypothetical protein